MKPEFGKWITDYGRGCSDCHRLFKGDEKYCCYCGTKRGKGKFKPYQNIMQCIYGPMPIKRVRECANCKMRWKPLLMIAVKITARLRCSRRNH